MTKFSNDWKSGRFRGAGRRNARSGQAILESCLVIVMMALVLFGLLEISRLFMGREVMNYAASVGARAHVVGFNDFMIYKTIRVAGIPLAGKLTSPETVLNDPNAPPWGAEKPGRLWNDALTANPPSPLYEQVERSRIPLYLGARSMAELHAVLDYEDWDQQQWSSFETAGNEVNTSVRQDVQLKFPFHRAFVDADEVREAGNATVDSHFPLYLQ